MKIPEVTIITFAIACICFFTLGRYVFPHPFTVPEKVNVYIPDVQTKCENKGGKIHYYGDIMDMQAGYVLEITSMQCTIPSKVIDVTK